MQKQNLLKQKMREKKPRICEPHNRLLIQCVECGVGSSICKHHKRKSTCTICKPLQHLASTINRRIHSALKYADIKKTEKDNFYIGCTVKEYADHIEKLFEQNTNKSAQVRQMSWENRTLWHIDHILPLAPTKREWQNLNISIEECDKQKRENEIIKRLHYSNVQPLWANDNILKGNRFLPTFPL